MVDGLDIQKDLVKEAETYRLDYDDIRGMILEFWTEN
jgi:hypothetical protein